MQLHSLLLLTALSSVGIAAPASILDNICGPNNDRDDCLDPNQLWGFVPEPTQSATKPTTDPKEACFDKSEESYSNCLEILKKPELQCIADSDKVLDDCLKA